MEITVDSKHLKEESEIVAEQKKEIKLLGSQRKVAGHTMFEYNLLTKEIKPALYDEVKIQVNGSQAHQNTTRYKLVINEQCFYVQALNQKNALKKLIKAGIR